MSNGGQERATSGTRRHTHLSLGASVSPVVCGGKGPHAQYFYEHEQRLRDKFYPLVFSARTPREDLIGIESLRRYRLRF